MKARLLSLFYITIAATSAQADGDRIVGIIIDADQSPYVGGKDEAQALPYVAYETDRLHIGIDEINYSFVDTGQLSVKVFLTPRFAPDFPDTDLFAGLDRDDTVELGFDATYSFGAAYVGASLQGDIAGAHDGFSGEAKVGYEFDFDAVALDIGAGLKLRDANLNNYLYGVSAAEATASRQMFEMDDTANGFAEISALMPIAENVFLVGEVSVVDLGEAANSPLVDRSRQTNVLVGIGYQF